MRRKMWITIGAAMILTAGFLWTRPPACATVEAREARLEEVLTSGSGWNLVAEQELEGYLIGGAVDASGRPVLAVFAPEGRGYQLQQAYGEGAGVVQDIVRINETWYDLAWFGGAATEYAEITYTVDGETLGPYRYDTADMPVLCRPAPSNHYQISVTYYDDQGNPYT